MKKVLIISPQFFGYENSVAMAFEDLGYQVIVVTYDEPIHPFKGLMKWQYKFSGKKQRATLKEKSRQKFNRDIKQVYDKYYPDIVFSFNGTILSSETLDYFRLASKTMIWMYDSVFRSDKKDSISHIDHVDAFFCFEERDVEYYRNIDKTAYFLPLACDTHVYYPIPNTKDIDILFVGYIYGNEKRECYLEMIVKRYPNLNILIYGPYKPYYKNPVKWLFRKHRKIFKNINIAPEKVNELYSRCKIALNIHHPQTISGANQRVFESSGAGAYQICDANPFIESLFPHQEIGLYRNEDELIQSINNALAHDQSENIEKAREIILNNHTFLHRVRTMLQVIGEL